MKKNKLYTANKWNRPAFMPKENLFLNGGNTNALAQADYQKNPWNYTQDYMYGNGSSITDQYLNSKNAFGISKRMNPFSKANLGIAPGGSALKGVGSAMGSALIGGVEGMGAQIIGDTIGGIAGAVGNGASSLLGGKKKSGVGSAVQGVTGGLGDIVGGVPIVGGLAKGALDLVGGVVGGALNGVFGSELNEEKIAEVAGNNDKRKAENDAFFGINSTDELFNSIGNLTGAMAFTQDDIGEDGWFSSDAADKFQELQAEQQKVNKMRNVAVGSTVGKVNRNQFITNMKHNITAYGGPLDMGGGAIDYGLAMDYLTMKKQQNEAKNRVPGISSMPTINTFGHGGCFNPFALGGNTEVPQDNTKVFRPMMLPIQRQQNFSDSEYFWDAGKEYPAGLWKHKDGTFHTTGSYGKDIVLTQEEADSIIRATKAKNRREKFRKAMENHKQTNSSENLFAFGGDMQTNSSDFPTGLMHIDAGQSHEQNPNEGVQLGTDQNGVPNLVEENETVWNDYVFSARIPIDQTTKELFHIGKKREMTYADLSKKLEKEISERVNDPISRAGFEKQMEMLEEQQERQKQEMDAQRAKAAFEALSPEEQVAVMENAAQQEAMAEQAAMQQPSPEEIAIAQQQQAMADGSQAALGQEPQMMAEGGNLFKKGGKKNAGTWKKGSAKENWDKYSRNGLRDFLLKVNDDLAEAKTDEDKNKIRENAIKTVRGIQQAYSEAYQNNLTPSEVNEKVTALQKAFQEAGGNAYFSDIADNINMPKGHNTADTEEKGWVDGLWGPRTSIRNWGSTEYGDDYDDIRELAAEAGLTYAPGQYKYGDNTLYELGMAQPDVAAVPEDELQPDPYTEGWEERRGIATAPEGTKTPEEEKGVAPKHRAEWLRYAGLFGPAVGLGMMAAGVGRPDTAQLDAAVAGAGDVNTADWKPLGNYLTYRPLDIWFEQNRLNANARATDRAIINNASPIGTKMAGLLAAGYNSQIASGNLFRQAQEYNDNLRKQVAEFNRGTDQWNSGQYGETSRFNANARNQARQHNAQLRLQTAAQKMDADAGWYNSLYGNIAGLFKGIGDIGTENFRMNRIGEMAARGDFGTATDETYGFEPYLTRSNRKSKKNR